MTMDPRIVSEIFEGLAHNGWISSQKLFTKETCLDLARECQKLAHEGHLQKASIGRGSTKAVQNEVRGDFIQWLDEHPFQTHLELLRKNLNEYFFLGLKRVEAHFAFYPPGAGYDKHVDNHQGLNHRKITFVLYLNENWQMHDGGELWIYNPNDESKLLAKIEPTLGTLVLFRSELFPHQVQTSKSERLSLTGWFRDDIL